MNTGVTSLGRLTAEQKAYKRLRNAIIRGDYKPGEQIDLDAIAEKFEMSKTPIHAAVDRLESRHIVVVEPRKGTFVADPSLQDFHDAVDVQLALELMAAEASVAQVASHEHPTGLRSARLLNIMADALSESNLAAWHYSRMIAGVLITIAENRQLERQWREITGFLRLTEWYAAPGESILLSQEADTVMAALESGDLPSIHSVLRRRAQELKDVLTEAME